VHFDIKKLGDESELENRDIDPNWNEIEDIVDIGVEVIKYSKVRPKSLRKDPFWVKNDKESKHTNQVIDFWPLQDENSNNFGSKRANEKQVCGRTLSYESTGPHDERYYGSKIYSNIIFFFAESEMVTTIFIDLLLREKKAFKFKSRSPQMPFIRICRE